MPKRNRPNLTREQLDEAQREYARCRALQHSWDPIPVTRPPSFGAAIDLRCIHCGTVRRDIFSRITGQRLCKPIYDHPLGYSNVERHDKNWWRAAWVEGLDTTLVNTDNEAARQVTHLSTRRRRAS